MTDHSDWNSRNIKKDKSMRRKEIMSRILSNVRHDREIGIMTDRLNELSPGSKDWLKQLKVVKNKFWTVMRDKEDQLHDTHQKNETDPDDPKKSNALLIASVNVISEWPSFDLWIAWL